MATDSKTAADGVLEEHGDGRYTLRYERHYDHPIERVWAALTETAEMVAWWGDADVELVEGGEFTVRWLNTDDEGNTSVMNAKITELDPPNVLVTDGDVHGVLRWELRAEGEGTALIFSSTLELPDEDQRTMNLAGWHIHLEHLADALEGREVDWPNWTRDHRPRWDELHEAYKAKLAG
jgi:uncharacterized protein YndB with AHSA1/START domain